jgi:hypothetical protein
VPFCLRRVLSVKEQSKKKKIYHKTILLPEDINGKETAIIDKTSSKEPIQPRSSAVCRY